MSKKKAKSKKERLEKLDTFLDDRMMMILGFAFCMSVAIIHLIGTLRMAGVM